MGIIQRQALRNTLINFAGNILGGTTRIIMPLLSITPTQIGLLNLFDFISGIFTMFFTFGFDQIMIKLFPRFRDDNKGHYGFLAFGFFLSLFGILVSFILFYFVGDYFLKENDDINLYRRFSFLVFPMIFFRIIFTNIDSYSRMLFNTVIGVFLETFLSKMVIVFALIAFGLTWVGFDWLMYLYALAFCIPGLVVMFYALIQTNKLTLPHREVFIREHRFEMYRYAAFGLLMGASSSVVIYIDSFMIGKMISLEAMGIYSIFFMAARFILIPGRSIHRIATVVLAEAWQKREEESIAEIYRKSCVNQLLLGAFLLGVGYISIQPVMALSHEYDQYIPYVNLFLILGVGFLIEMGTGVNMAIIATSSLYKFNTYFNIIMAIMVFTLNLLMIHKMGLTGCALASMISMTFVNFLRWYLLYKKYNLQPFNLNFLKALILSVAFLTLCIFLDYDANPILKIIINLIGLSLLFWGLVVSLKLSVDVNKWLLKMKTKFF